MNIPLSSPDITQQEIDSVVAVLRTPHLSLGPKLPEFEERFAAYLGAKYAVAVNSGTSGLHLCVRALEIGEGDEVITTPFSFVASSNCLLFEQAKPVFVDIREDTLNLDEARIEAAVTERTRAILPVHVFGYPSAMEKIAEIATRRRLRVIEDACEAIGAELGGRKAGTFGDCSVFAFYPNKQMTTGEGGMIVTDDRRIAELAISMRNQGRDAGMGWLAHNRLGYNYRLSDINCALGLAQLERIGEILAKRQTVARKYRERLSGLTDLILPPDDVPGIARSWFVYVVRLRDSYSGEQRDELIRLLRAEGIGCNVYFPAIHLQPFYARFGFRRGDFPVTERVSERTLAIPFYNNLPDGDLDRVAAALKNNLEKVRKYGQ